MAILSFNVYFSVFIDYNLFYRIQKRQRVMPVNRAKIPDDAKRLSRRLPEPKTTQPPLREIAGRPTPRLLSGEIITLVSPLSVFFRISSPPRFLALVEKATKLPSNEMPIFSPCPLGLSPPPVSIPFFSMIIGLTSPELYIYPAAANLALSRRLFRKCRYHSIG